MNLVMVDTHVAAALYNGKLAGYSPQAQKLLDASVVRISPAVRFELELLFEIGRTQKNATHVCDYLLQQLGVTESPEKFSEIVRHALPIGFTRDPFDRLIVAHASLLRAPLITLDTQIQKHYARAVK